MPDPWFGDCPRDDGDAGIARGIDVQTCTVHRTIGSWPGDYSVGKHRSHDEGTFHFLIGQDDGQWVQFYPVNTFASHAAGSNEVGPGIEISGQNGEPLTDWQMATLGKILRWLRDEWGIAPSFTDGDPRIWADHAAPLGFITHRHVAYPPDPRYQHQDFITDDEFHRAIGDTPTPPEDDDMKGTFIKAKAGDGKLFYFHAGVRRHCATKDHVDLINLFGQSGNDYEHPAEISQAQLDAIPEAGWV